VGYQAIVYIASGEEVADHAALTRLCRSFVNAQEKLHLLYIAEHHVTGFGSMTARHHIANDMQIKQEIFPRLKVICERLDISSERIDIRFGNRALVIERFVQDREIDLLAIGAGMLASNKSVVKLLTGLIERRACDLHVTQ
jgi:hypothetical protein